MKSLSRLLLALSLFFLSACHEKKEAVEKVSTVRLDQASPDWNDELALIASEEVLGKAAGQIGTDIETLKNATRIEADIENQSIRILALHQDPEQAQAYADGLAKAYQEARNPVENEAALHGSLPTLEQDRMSYEKAKKSLEEDPE